MDKLENMKKFRFWVWVVIIVAVIAGWLKFPKFLIDYIISKIVLGPILGIATGAIAGQYAEILDNITGGLLKKEWVFEIFEIEFSVPVIIIVTAFIEFVLFY